MTTSSRSPFPTSFFSMLAKAEAEHWWFRSRNRLLLWLLAAKIKHFSTLLEVGCGTGFVLHAIRNAYPAVTLYGTEYFDEGLAIARQRVPSAKFRQLDAIKMDDIDCFDVIGAFDVIEHIEQDELVLRNLARALKPGGKVVLTVPQHPWLWSVVDEQACHVRRYTRKELTNKVREAGFTIEFVSSFVSLLLPLMLIARTRARGGNYDPMSEFRIPGWLNKILEFAMSIELFFIKLGMRFPIGGSLILLAKKP